MNPYSFNFPYNMSYNMPYMTNSIGNMTRFSNIGRIPSNGLFNRLTNSLGAFRRINWSSLLNNTSRTLGVINQAIPIVKQTGPMISNMRSMLRLASAFKDETGNSQIRRSSSNTNSNIDYEVNQKEYEEIKKEDTISNNSTLPNFFL